MSNYVRLGVVGTGSISIRGILPHLSMEDVQDRVRLTAVCDPVYERAQAAAAKFNVPHYYREAEELFASGHCDAVCIASPIGFHYEQGKSAIEHGLHVHFNKSMTTTVDEADDLIARAAKKRVKLVSCPGQMLRPVFQRYREMIQAGELGTLTWAVTGAAFGRYHENERVRGGSDPLTNVNPAWYFRRPGGGPLYDMTVYGLHALTGILGPAKRVTGMSGVRLHEREFNGQMLPTDMDDNSFLLLDFGDNLTAVVYGAAAGGIPGSWGPMIFGTKGVLSDGKLNGQPIDYPGRDLEEQYKDANAALPHVVGAHRGNEEAHVYEDVMQLVDWILYDKPTVSSAEHARHVIEIFDAGYRASASGQTQTLRTTF